MMGRRSQTPKAIRERALREWYAEHGICVSCGQADAEPGRTQCGACARKALARVKKWDPDGSKHRQNMQALREERKARGLCVDCGLPAGKYIRCAACRQKHRETYRLGEIRKRLKREAEKERARANG